MSPIANMLVQIKNAQMARHSEILVPFSKIKLTIASILKDSGYIAEIDRRNKKIKKSEHEYLALVLKYTNGVGALHGVKMISRPSRRMYIKAEEIRPVRSGYGLAIISTSKGVMNSKDAWKQKIGGEIICEIW
ncbi:30S ribosomal protein S8 [Candidatus Parcubacteria bacterium]|nr:30S ribosomal protein S8 [Candidatus Parcubacteria bacterium]